MVRSQHGRTAANCQIELLQPEGDSTSNNTDSNARCPDCNIDQCPCISQVWSIHGFLHVQIEGDITYNGEPFSSFFPQRTAAYVDQVSLPVLAPHPVLATDLTWRRLLIMTARRLWSPRSPVKIQLAIAWLLHGANLES